MLAFYSWIIVTCMFLPGEWKALPMTLATRRQAFTLTLRYLTENGNGEHTFKFQIWVGYGVFGRTTFGGEVLRFLILHNV